MLDELSLALRCVQAGRIYVSPDIAVGVMQEQPDRQAMRLTPRQTDVLKGIAAGLSNKEMARQMQVSVKTVEYHRAELIARLDLHDVASLTRFALSEGLIH